MKSIGDKNDSNEGYTYRKRFLGEKKYQVHLLWCTNITCRRKLPNYRISHSSITHYSNGNCEKAAALANIDTGYLAKDIGHEIAEAKARNC